MAEKDKDKKQHSNLWKRIMTGVPLALGAGVIVWSGGIWFALLVVLAVWFAISELGTFLRLRGIEPQWYVAVLGSLAMMASAYLLSYSWLNIALMAVIVSICLGEVVRYPKRHQPLYGAAGTIFLVIYGGWLPAHAILLRNLRAVDTVGLDTLRWSDLGLILVGLLLLTCVATDVGAYAFGKTLGCHKLCPKVSPGKTIEGALGGILCALLFAWGWSVWSGFPLLHCLSLAGIGSVISQFGDLFESALKRDVGVKDSSNLIAGHGGALDRLDSFLMGVPFFYIYVFCFILKNIT